MSSLHGRPVRSCASVVLPPWCAPGRPEAAKRLGSPRPLQRGAAPSPCWPLGPRATAHCRIGATAGRRAIAVLASGGLALPRALGALPYSQRATSQRATRAVPPRSSIRAHRRDTVLSTLCQRNFVLLW